MLLARVLPRKERVLPRKPKAKPAVAVPPVLYVFSNLGVLLSVQKYGLVKALNELTMLVMYRTKEHIQSTDGTTKNNMHTTPYGDELLIFIIYSALLMFLLGKRNFGIFRAVLCCMRGTRWKIKIQGLGPVVNLRQNETLYNIY